MKHKKPICLLLVFTIWSSLFAPFAAAQNGDSAARQNTEQTKEKGLQFRVRERVKQADEQKVSTLAETVDLSRAETSALLRRLPRFDAVTADKSDFALRPDSLPPPKTGSVVAAKFPADERQNAPNINQNISAALEVVRFSPTGDVPLVTDLSVTFSQPMIAITSQAQASENAPIALMPAVKGKWRWLGTKTLIFDADGRFPMATKFTATIPARTKSAIGGETVKEISWTFSTAPPTVINFQPNNETVRRSQLLIAEFNQEINAEAVLRKISAAAAANNQKIPLRLATENEIAADRDVSEKIENLPPKRFVVFRAAESLPPDSQIGVAFEAGMPSAEGNLLSIAAQSYSFKTFGSLKFVKSYCGYDEDRNVCQSYGGFQIKFNNRLDEMSFDKSLIKIEPNIEDAEISVSGDEIEIRGYKKSRADYKVTIAAALRDEFGQTLGDDVTANFKIDAEQPDLSGDGNHFVVLDPNAKPRYSIYSTNYADLKVRLYKVEAEDFPAFQAFQSNDDAKLPTFGKLVFDKSIRIKSADDERTETNIDVSAALTNNLGHAVLIVEPPAAAKSENENQRVVVWLERTQIGVDAFADYEKINVFTTDLKTGKPLNGVQVTILNGVTGTTNENGIAALNLPETSKMKKGLLIARRGADSAILFEDNYGDESSWTRKSPRDALRWFVFDDRNIYRTGETVSIKGYIRRIAGGKFADISELDGGAAKSLSYVLKDSRGVEVLKGTANFNAFGAFDFKLNLPENLNLGEQDLELTADGVLEEKEFTHSFQVQEFRRPEFEVGANVETIVPFYVGDSAQIGVEAKYYSGGFLANAETKWKVTAAPTDYTPTNRADYTFGKFIPWWRDDYESGYEETNSQEFKGATDLNGKHRIALDFVSANPARPYRITAEASVQDVNRQTFSSTTNLLVHPSEVYVGLRTAKTFVRAGEQFKIETMTTDIDGKPVGNAPVSMTAELKDWRQIKGEWKEVIVDTQNCRITSRTTAVSCDLTAKQGGVFTIKASVSDRRGRPNESELTVWVAGGKSEPKLNVEREEAQLIPDKEEYSPNDVAEILVNAPFFPAEGVLTLRRGGIVKTERFTMNENSIVLRVPIEERYLPNIHAQIDLVGAARRIVYEDERDAKLPKRPAFASGELNLNVSTASRKLNVTAEPVNQTLEPGGATVVNVAVKDDKGNAVTNGEVALVAVDESVLALTNYKILNPLDVFYQQIESGATDYHSRENVLLDYPDDVGIGGGSGSGYGNGMGGGGGGGGGGRLMYSAAEPLSAVYVENASVIDGVDSPIRIRQNFDALAAFSPSVKTDANGRAVVKIKLPDNLTRYRITAIAATKSRQFGSGESNVTARQSLMVRPSAPRFMNFGDKIELPVVIQNQTDKAMTVDVVIRAVNADLMNRNGKRVTIAANDRREIRFDVGADKAGTARFQIGAASGKLADAAEIEFPVYTPATSESFATYGTTDENTAIVQPIETPKDVYTQFGGLEVTTSSTQLQELTDAFIYLQNYPYECTEQISSRILSVAALRDVLTAFDAKGLPSKAEIEAKMKSDIEKLQKLQHADGGFSFWRNDDESFPFVSVHVAHALARAVSNGYTVSPDTIAKSRGYLQNVESKYPAFYSPESRRAISAYALYVRNLFGEKDAAKARRLLLDAGLEKLSPESLGWILSVLADDGDLAAEVDSIKRHLLNRVTETAGAAHFVADYADGEYVLLASERRADGVILESLLKAEPSNELIPKIVRGLLAGKTKGRWSNTQENVFILLALDKYFQTYEKVTPDFVAKIWLGQAYAGQQNFKGRSVDSNSVNVPMTYLQEQREASDLILDRRGDGRLYYRIALNYASKNLKLEAADYGFAVTRKYEAIDDAGDIRQNADGSWTIKAGARIRVKLQMVASARRYHVALVDKLPAGLEIINPELAISGTLSKDESEKPPVMGYGRRPIWFEHQNLRDERAEAFASLLNEGVWSYSYAARATTPGNFVAPPAKAEEMYAPETFGRTRTDFVKIE